MSGKTQFKERKRLTITGQKKKQSIVVWTKRSFTFVVLLNEFNSLFPVQSLKQNTLLYSGKELVNDSFTFILLDLQGNSFDWQIGEGTQTKCHCSVNNPYFRLVPTPKNAPRQRTIYQTHLKSKKVTPRKTKTSISLSFRKVVLIALKWFLPWSQECKRTVPFDCFQRTRPHDLA